MKNLYSIFLGAVMVTGLFFLVDTLFYNNNSLTTNLFIIILLLGGYVVTYTSSTLKTRTAIFSGLLVGMVLMIYQLIFNRSAIEMAVIGAYFILPGFFMMIGGFTAKLTNKQLKELLDHFLKRKFDGESKSSGK
ncbi:MAG: hypothetical protein F8N15_08970 [Methanobacterium sp.]|nr:hypothetical protein [Methanobacterium sp.]